MKRSEINGLCSYCKKEIKKTKSSIIKHLTQCTTRNERQKGSETPGLLLLLEGAYDPDYWMVIRVKSETTMKKVDAFIRAIWVECCEHMSAFSYEKNRYGGDEIGMSQKVSTIFGNDISVRYDYDFGTTTTVILTSIGEIKDTDRSEILVLFRNKEIETPCSNCGKKAVAICRYCLYDETGYLCESCLKTHECLESEGEEAMLPLANSPRLGECGYTGPLNIKVLKSFFPAEII